MNILYIGPYTQRDGWGNAAKAYVKSLIASGHNLTIRPVFMNNDTKFDKCEDFERYEKKVFKNYDIIIQNVLPHLFRYYGPNIINVGLSYFESENIGHTMWVNNINTLDRMWVTSNWEKQTLVKSGVTIPVDVIPISCDPTIYDKSYEYEKLSEYEDEFKFYFIGEHISRKNITSLLLAFHREFHPDEKARVVLKLNRLGMNDHELFSTVAQQIQNLKIATALYSQTKYYKPEIVICSRLSNEELYGLHQMCQCFVAPSFGEGFCMPAFDAMAFNKTPIVVRDSSLSDFITEETGYLTDSFEVPAVAADRPLSFLYNGRDTWRQISIMDLQIKMREAFNTKICNSVPSKQMTNKYSHKNVGMLINQWSQSL